MRRSDLKKELRNMSPRGLNEIIQYCSRRLDVLLEGTSGEVEKKYK